MTLPRVGDRIRLRSGETCEVALRSATPKGATLWHLRCLSHRRPSDAWLGIVSLTTRELGYNVA